MPCHAMPPVYPLYTTYGHANDYAYTYGYTNDYDYACAHDYAYKYTYDYTYACDLGAWAKGLPHQ